MAGLRDILGATAEATQAKTPLQAVQSQLKLVQTLQDNFRIRGQGVSGNLQNGYCVRCPPCEEAAAPEGSGGIPTPTPTGACCRDGVCTVETQTSCESDGGIYQGNDSTCEPNPCPQPPTGACCVGESCTIETGEGCAGLGGIYQGDDTTCEPNPCVETGACCREDACTVESQESCESDGGIYYGDGTDCDPSPCGELPCGECSHAGWLGEGQWKTLTKEVSGTITFSSDSSPRAFTTTFTSIRVEHCDPSICESCSGTGHTEGTNASGDPFSCDFTLDGCNPGADNFLDQVSGCESSGECESSGGPDFSPGENIVSDAVRIITWDSSSDAFGSHWTWDAVRTETFSEPCIL
jgi:hypothetical protein